MDGCRVSVQLNHSHVRRLLSRPSLFQRFLRYGQLWSLLCYVPREKNHDRANRFDIILSHLLSLLSPPLS